MARRPKSHGGGGGLNQHRDIKGGRESCETPGRALCKNWINLFRDLKCISCEEAESEIHSISSVCALLRRLSVYVCA